MPARLRHRRSSASVWEAIRPALAWNRSPSTTIRRAPVRWRALSSRARSSLVVPIGIGIPAARKVDALPQCRSATTSVLVPGQYSARSLRR